MHTSKVLQSTDFQFSQHGPDGETGGSFDSFCPDYQILDRVGVVSPHLDDGIVHAGYALLALVTSFYDVLRASGEPFFDYPPHFALIGATTDDCQPNTTPHAINIAVCEPTWGNLDVWPDSQWLFAPPTATTMLKKVFDTQISRLFWPEGLVPNVVTDRLPPYVRRLLSTRLKSVYYYDTLYPDVDIHVTQVVEDMVQTSLIKIPPIAVSRTSERRVERTTQPKANSHAYYESYRNVAVPDFLAAMAACFDN